MPVQIAIHFLNSKEIQEMDIIIDEECLELLIEDIMRDEEIDYIQIWK